VQEPAGAGAGSGAGAGTGVKAKTDAELKMKRLTQQKKTLLYLKLYLRISQALMLLLKKYVAEKVDSRQVT
jgi:hypothetical protein